MSRRRYDGPAIDGAGQHISEAPYWQDPDGETVYATEPEPEGEERTVDEPADDGDQDDVDDDRDRDDRRDRRRRDRRGEPDGPTSQATLADFGGGSA